MRNDPMERIVADALTDAGIAFSTEREPINANLDFYLPGPKVHIEVKQWHTPRIAKQMSRVDNVIAIQGIEAARFFGSILKK